MYLCLQFQSHRLNIRVQRSLLSLMSLLGLWRTLEVPDWGFITWTIYEWVIYVRMYSCLKFQSHRLNIRVPRTLLSLMSSLRLWRTLEVPDWGFITRTVYAWVIYFLMYLGLKFQSYRLNTRMQRTLLSLMSLLGLWRTLEVPDWNFLEPVRYHLDSFS